LHAIKTVFTLPIDLTAPAADYEVIPPTPMRLIALTQQWEIKTTGGVIAVAPTVSLGSNATFDNLSASQTKAGFITQPAETAVPLSFVAPLIYADLTLYGLKVRVTAPATGTSPVLTARVVFSYITVPL